MSQITRKVGEPLTLENYFNALRESNPESVDRFCKWVDVHKANNKWGSYIDPLEDTRKTVKFHDLPLAMQVGILLEYWNATLLVVMQNLPDDSLDSISDEEAEKANVIEIWVLASTRCFQKNATPKTMVQLDEDVAALQALMAL